MGRLIDVDDLIELLGFESTQEERDENVGVIITLEDIDNLPTAYDVDAVVSELGKASCVAQPVGWSAKKEIVELKTAIEIVKGGGVDG